MDLKFTGLKQKKPETERRFFNSLTVDLRHCLRHYGKIDSRRICFGDNLQPSEAKMFYRTDKTDQIYAVF